MSRISAALLALAGTLAGCGASSSPPVAAPGTIQFGRSISARGVGDITTSFKAGDKLYLHARFTQASQQYELELQDPNTCDGRIPFPQVDIRQVSVATYTRDAP